MKNKNTTQTQNEHKHKQNTNTYARIHDTHTTQRRHSYTGTTREKHNTPSWPCFACTLLQPGSPGPAPNFENNGKIQASDWSKILIPRGTMKKISLFFENADEHAWAAPAREL